MGNSEGDQSLRTQRLVGVAVREASQGSMVEALISSRQGWEKPSQSVSSFVTGTEGRPYLIGQQAPLVPLNVGRDCQGP